MTFVTNYLFVHFDSQTFSALLVILFSDQFNCHVLMAKYNNHDFRAFISVSHLLMKMNY